MQFVRYRFVHIATLIAAGALVLTACGSGHPDQGSMTSTPTATSSSTAASNSLGLASTSLGKVVVDGHGMTVYVFDADHQGAQTSACTGGCAAIWPPVLVTGTPTLTGVTGAVGTIPAAGGMQQVTLNGWPLYTYAKDNAPGQTTGQGYGGTWWVVGPTGSKMTTPTSSPSTSTGSGGGGYGGY